MGEDQYVICQYELGQIHDISQTSIFFEKLKTSPC